jgi:SAM-dependent methyltransferase
MADEELSPARIMQIATGGWAASILATAAIHSIFTHVEAGADTPELISRRAGVSLRGAGTLLDGLVGLGLMTVSGGRYRNDPDAAEFLVEGKPGYMGGFAKVVFARSPGRTRLPEAVRTGQTEASEAEKPENPFWEELVPAIAVLSIPVILAAAERLKLAAAGPISILDVGGGSGVYSAIWLGMNPQARATQLDWPNVNRLARGFVGARGVADRFRTVDGDFHTTDFGTAEYDVAVYSHIAHQESPASNVAIFKKFRKALKPGGTLLISDFVVENDRSGPPFSLLFRSEMLLSAAEGSTYTRADYEAWLRDAGFTSVAIQPTPSPATLVFAS